MRITQRCAGAPTAPSDSDYEPTTPPPAPARGRTKKPSAKVLEAQRSLRTRTDAPRAAQTSHGAAAAHDELPPFPTRRETRRETISPERTESSSKLEELVGLVVSLRDTIKEQSSMIAGQNRVIESVQSELAAIKAEQQHVKDQNTKLRETIRSRHRLHRRGGYGHRLQPAKTRQDQEQAPLARRAAAEQAIGTTISW